MTDRGPNLLADLLAPFWTANRTAEVLQLTPEQLETRCQQGAILGVRPSDGNARFFPVFQFERLGDGRVRVKPGLAAFKKRLDRNDPWTVGVCALTPMDELGGLSPVTWLRKGGSTTKLVELAEILNSEWR